MAVQPPSLPYTLQSLSDIMAALRNPATGCPWDQEQDFASIAPYAIEEAYEVSDAVDRHDWQALTDELGDLLLQVVFHAQMARERELFDLSDVLTSICTKMIRRHPHVFGDGAVASADEQATAWEVMKASERQQSGSRGELDGVALSLPALLRAEKLQRRAARVGFDWPDAVGPLDKIHEEIAEVQEALSHDGDVAAEIGDLLFSVVNWARHLGVAPEDALRTANARFERRFAMVEELAGEEPMAGLGIDRLDQLWQQAKVLTVHRSGG